MGIYIYGRDLPVNYADLRIYCDGTVREIDPAFVQDDECVLGLETTKAIETQTHGRLVDADEVAESIRRQTDIVRSWNIDDMTQIADIFEKGFLQELDNADTVIEGDGT